MIRPCMIVPHDIRSLKMLYQNIVNEKDSSIYTMSMAEFNDAFQSGFFSHLNTKYKLFIDDYETEFITNLVVIEKILSEDLDQFKIKKGDQFWSNLERLLHLALAYKTAICFML